ncbi:MAG: prolyl oligopeptidase family serine peptidase [Siphonobacter sp.]
MNYRLLIILLFWAYMVSAQDLSLYQKKEYTHSNGKVLPYRILYPEHYDKSKKYPLVLFLHGAGERGSDNEKQLTNGGKLFLEHQQDFPCIVVFPQCPQDSYWASAKIDRSTTPLTIGFNYTNAPNWPLTSAIELLKQLSKEEGVDTKRMYIIGLSMGGMGTFETLYRYPKVFAAAVPICGGGDVEKYDKRILKTSFWVFHGAEDNAVEVKNSRQMVEKLHTLHANVKYTEYPNVGHNSWVNAFAEPDLLPWLFSYKRKKAKFN